MQLHVYYACPEAIFWKLLETNFIRVFLFTELDGVKLLKDRKIFIIVFLFFFILLLFFSFYAAGNLFRPNPTQIEDFYYCIFIIYYYFCLMILPYITSTGGFFGQGGQNIFGVGRNRPLA